MRRRIIDARFTCAVLLFVATAPLPMATTARAGASSAATDSFVQAVRRVRPSVVGVGSYDAQSSPSVIYFGTGFVFDDGTVVATNAHVVEGIRQQKQLDRLRVFFADGTIDGRGAEVMAEDRFHDVALLRLAGPPALTVELNLAEPEQGQTIGVLGYPIGLKLGLVPAAHKGVVAAVVPAVLPMPRGVSLTPELIEAIQHPYNFYQLDVVVFPGNSGSPLFDSDGRVLGIINKTLASKTREHLLDSPSGIGYAVPARWIQELLLRSTASSKASKDAVPTGEHP